MHRTIALVQHVKLSKGQAIAEFLAYTDSYWCYFGIDEWSIILRKDQANEKNSN